MSSSRNRSGLRILWIPGRKRHNRKGHYDSTNKKIDYSKNSKQGKNEMWSFGGTKGHEEFVKSDISAGETSITSQIIPASCVIGVSAGIQDSNMKIEENSEQISEANAEKRNRDHKNNKNVPDDINSIEQITDNGYKNLYDGKSNIDIPDGSFQNMNTDTKKDINNKAEDDDATVKCLYYTLMCCECTIS